MFNNVTYVKTISSYFINIRLNAFNILSNLVIGDGNVFADLLIVGEAPGSKEDLEGKPFVGKSGQLLKNLLLISKINLSDDVYFCNVIKSRPPKNRKPTKEEVVIHKPWLLQQIKLVDPKIIILTGSTAMKAILKLNEPIKNIRGNWIEKDNRQYMIIFHPSYLLRFSKEDIDSPYALTLKDLQKVRKKLYSIN